MQTPPSACRMCAALRCGGERVPGCAHAEQIRRRWEECTALSFINADCVSGCVWHRTALCCNWIFRGAAKKKKGNSLNASTGKKNIGSKCNSFLVLLQNEIVKLIHYFCMYFIFAMVWSPGQVELGCCNVRGPTKKKKKKMWSASVQAGDDEKLLMGKRIFPQSVNVVSSLTLIPLSCSAGKTRILKCITVDWLRNCFWPAGSKSAVNYRDKTTYCIVITWTLLSGKKKIAS